MGRGDRRRANYRDHSYIKFALAPIFSPFCHTSVRLTIRVLRSKERLQGIVVRRLILACLLIGHLARRTQGAIEGFFPQVGHCNLQVFDRIDLGLCCNVGRNKVASGEDFRLKGSRGVPKFVIFGLEGVFRNNVGGNCLFLISTLSHERPRQSGGGYHGGRQRRCNGRSGQLFTCPICRFALGGGPYLIRG